MEKRYKKKTYNPPWQIDNEDKWTNETADIMYCAVSRTSSRLYVCVFVFFLPARFKSRHPLIDFVLFFEEWYPPSLWIISSTETDAFSAIKLVSFFICTHSHTDTIVHIRVDYLAGPWQAVVSAYSSTFLSKWQNERVVILLKFVHDLSTQKTGNLYAFTPLAIDNVVRFQDADAYPYFFWNGYFKRTTKTLYFDSGVSVISASSTVIYSDILQLSVQNFL